MVHGLGGNALNWMSVGPLLAGTHHAAVPTAAIYLLAFLSGCVIDLVVRNAGEAK